jgi:hypothetical protein
MYVVTILSLKDWFIIIGLGILILWFVWIKLKHLIFKDPK